MTDHPRSGGTQSVAQPLPWSKLTGWVEAEPGFQQGMCNHPPMCLPKGCQRFCRAGSFQLSISTPRGAPAHGRQPEAAGTECATAEQGASCHLHHPTCRLPRAFYAPACMRQVLPAAHPALNEEPRVADVGTKVIGLGRLCCDPADPTAARVI